MKTTWLAVGLMALISVSAGTWELGPEDTRLVQGVTALLQENGVAEPTPEQVLEALRSLIDAWVQENRYDVALALAELAARYTAEKFGLMHEQARDAALLADELRAAGTAPEAGGTEAGRGLSGDEDIIAKVRAALRERDAEEPTAADIADALNRIVVGLLGSGDYEEASGVAAIARDYAEGTLGAEHPHTLTSLNNLGVLPAAVRSSSGCAPYDAS